MGREETQIGGGIASWLVARPALLVALVAFALLSVRPAAQSVMAHDEAIYALEARTILATGDWVTQRVTSYDRAMGVQWLIAASQMVFGFSEWSCRLPSLLSALGSALLVLSIGRRIASMEAGLVGALILLATPIWMQAARLSTQDAPLVFVELLGVWALLRSEDGPAARPWALLAGAAFGIGYALKSFMILVAGAALLPYLFGAPRSRRHLLNPWLYAGVLLGLAPTVWWLGASVALHGSGVLNAMFGKLAKLSAQSFNGNGPTYYLWSVPLNAFPWALAALPGAVLALRGRVFNRPLLALGYPALLLVLLTLFRTRTWYYPLQALPYLSLLAAVWVLALGRARAAGESRWPQAVSWGMAAIGTVLLAAAALCLLRPGLAPVDPPKLAVVLGLSGVGFCMPAMPLRGEARAGPWIAALLSGPMLFSASMHATGLWGDYNPALRVALAQDAVASALAASPVAVVSPPPEASADDHKIALLLRAYAPRLIEPPADLAAASPGALLWIDADTLKAAGLAAELVGTAGSWRLVRVPGALGSSP